MGVGIYYSRSEVSNSDLSWLRQQLYPKPMPDPTEAYRFGSLIDAMITESERINFYKHTLDEDSFEKKEWEKSLRMRDAFFLDNECCQLHSLCSGQKEMVKYRQMEYNGYDFNLNVRCKWDLWSDSLGWGADIKSTTATSQSQFEAAVKHFDYDRQRAWYMDIANSDRDVLIGISKVNFKVFKVKIQRDSDLFRRGYFKYIELAFRWNILFGENKQSLC